MLSGDGVSDTTKGQELKNDMLCAYLARLFISFPNFQLTKGHAEHVEILRDARDTSLLLIRFGVNKEKLLMLVGKTIFEFSKENVT